MDIRLFRPPTKQLELLLDGQGFSKLHYILPEDNTFERVMGIINNLRGGYIAEAEIFVRQSPLLDGKNYKIEFWYRVGKLEPPVTQAQ